MIFDKISSAKTDLNSVLTQVHEQTSRLSQLSSDLEDIKYKTEHKGSSINDTSKITILLL